MNAVFCEEETIWNAKEKLAICSIKIYNYTARARAYTIIAKWPEGEKISIIHESMKGQRETIGLRKWRLDAINPGKMAEITFSVGGLGQGDWKEAEVFFRGSGEIIGCEKLDEVLVKDMKRQESLKEMVEDFEEELENHHTPNENVDLVNQISDQVEDFGGDFSKWVRQGDE